jgi:hypothetical protein
VPVIPTILVWSPVFTPERLFNFILSAGIRSPASVIVACGIVASLPVSDTIVPLVAEGVYVRLVVPAYADIADSIVCTDVLAGYVVPLTVNRCSS